MASGFASWNSEDTKLLEVSGVGVDYAIRAHMAFGAICVH